MSCLRQENPEGFRFCGMCGAALVPTAAPPREERKVVTILFTDLVGSTARAEGLDPEDVSATLSAYYAQLRAELERHGGTVEKFIGDAVMAVFGAPVAHEDDAERAVRAALAIRDSIGEELQIRTAVNTGEALVALGAKPGEGDAMVAGDVVNTAARLQSAAPVNGILVGEGTYRATRHAIDYREAPPVEAKGKAEPVKVWEAVARPVALRQRRRGEAADAARRAGARARASSPTRSRTRARSSRRSSSRSSACPGIGKSRLVAELFQITEADPDLITWRQGRSLPYGERVSFWALGEIVKAHAGILESDDAATAEEKLARWSRRSREDERERDWLARHTRPLVGLEGAERAEREEAFAAWRRLLEAAAEQRPLVLVFEDLHWADDGLLDFVDHLADWATTVPLLIVGTARPELLDRRPGWGGGKRNALTLSIGALTDDETAVLLQRLLDRAVLDADAQQAVLQRAEGNPLYAEEYARMLAEHEGGDLPLPETVQGLIAARIDGLAPEEKALLQDASVIGKVFWPGALPGADERVLHALERKEFVRRDRRSSIAGETQYAFLHALVRDVAYGQIPRAERAEKHRRAAEWLGSLAGDRTEDHAEMLAHHYREALSLARRGRARHERRYASRRARRSPKARAARALARRRRRRARARARGARADAPRMCRSGRSSSSSPPTPAGCWTARMSRRSASRRSRDFSPRATSAQAADAVAALGGDVLPSRRHRATRAARDRALELARQDPTLAVGGTRASRASRGADTSSTATWRARSSSRARRSRSPRVGRRRGRRRSASTRSEWRESAPGTQKGSPTSSRASSSRERSGSCFQLATGLNNLANMLWEVGRLADGSARIHEARAFCERYGFVALLQWNDAELVYDAAFRGDLEATIAGATRLLDRGLGRRGYQEPAATRHAGARRCSRSVRWSEALADAERARHEPGARPAPTPRSRRTSSRPPRCAAAPPDGARRPTRCSPRHWRGARRDRRTTCRSTSSSSAAATNTSR